MTLSLLAMSNFWKVETGGEVDENVDPYPGTPILPVRCGPCQTGQLTLEFGLASKQQRGLVRRLFISLYVNKHNNTKYAARHMSSAPAEDYTFCLLYTSDAADE